MTIRRSTLLYKILNPKKVVRDVFKNENENTKIHLLFANQTEKDILLREEIEEIKKNNPTRFSFMYTIDRPEEGWNYEKGFINQGNLPHFLAEILKLFFRND